MKILSRNITETFFVGTDFETMVKNWKEACKNKATLTATDNLLYSVLRGKNWRKAFTPLKSERKQISQNRTPFSAYAAARVNIKYDNYNQEVFGLLNTQEILKYLPLEHELSVDTDTPVYKEVA